MLTMLSPSQRVTLIREISRRLSSDEWTFIDVALKNFGFPCYAEGWNGEKLDYVASMISEGHDDDLIALAQHVGYQVEHPTKVQDEPKCWEKSMFRLFISHLAEHRRFAAALREKLLPLGISAFVAHDDIEPTAEWENEILTALTTCDSLVALLHKDFHDSYWTDQEIGFAMGRGLPTYAVQIDQNPYGFIGRFQAFNGNGKDAPLLAFELFQVYLKGDQTQPRMAEGLVKLFEDSMRFEDAKQRIGYLETLRVWEPSFSKRIQAASQTNRQIYDATGVPKRVSALVEKWSKSDS